MRCTNLQNFLAAETDVLKKHLPEHKFLRHLNSEAEAEISFISDYGWLIKEMYCSHICSQRETCDIAHQIKVHGDLLRDRVETGKG